MEVTKMDFMDGWDRGKRNRFDLWLSKVDVLCERYNVDRKTLIAIIFETNPEVNWRMLFWPSGEHVDFSLGIMTAESAHRSALPKEQEKHLGQGGEL